MKIHIIAFHQAIMYEAFRHVETVFVQVRNLVQAGLLLVGGIAPTNSRPVRYKVST